ncbi:MAG: hypothetical protein AB1424_06045 [Thermodesulfobacteriota bacterium]
MPLNVKTIRNLKQCSAGSARPTLDFQNPLQEQHRDAAFLASHQPDHPEPFGQRGSGLVEHVAGDQIGLIATGLEMIEVTGAMKISLTRLATGTTKSLGTASAKQMFLTGFLVAKLFLKLHQDELCLLYRLATFNQLVRIIIPYYSRQRK